MSPGRRNNLVSIMHQDECVVIDSEDEGEMKIEMSGEMEEVSDFAESKLWYSITFQDDMGHSLEDILTALLQNITPLSFVPVLVENSDRETKKIYVTQCKKAIKKISSQGFHFYCKQEFQNPISLNVAHNDPPPTKISPMKLLSEVVSLRHTKSIHKLDLSNFQDDFMLRGKVFFPLWYPGNQTIMNILVRALSLTPLTHSLDLSHNQITQIGALNILMFSKIHTLNLSNNNLKNFEALRCLQKNKKHTITTLNLDGNELCADFVGETNYITCVKMIFPALIKLDDRVLTVAGLPHARRNCSVDWGAVPLVDKFMSTYFTLFDSEDRDGLCAMYAPKAVLSVSGSTNASNSFLPKKKCRNLLHNSQPNSSIANIFVGPRGIVGRLSTIPQTLHDPFSFHVDVMSHSNTHTVVAISGVVKVPASNVSDEEPVYEFMRCFVLSNVGSPDNSYLIHNDMMTFSSITTQMSKEAFKCVPVSKLKLSLESIQQHLTESVSQGLIDIFMYLTEFPYMESKTCLEKNKWNLRAALTDATIIIQNTEMAL